MSHDLPDDEDMSMTMLTFKFMIIRSFGNTIDARQASMKIELLRDDDDHSQEDFELLISRCRTWFSEVVSNSLIFSINNTYAFKCIFEDGIQVSNNFPMITPGDPTDDMLCMMFQAKLNAFAEGMAASFGVVELHTVRPPMDDITSVYCGWAYDDLPAMVDWIGEKAYHTAPWWARNDGSTMDLVPDPEDDLLTPPEQGYDMSYLTSRYSRKSAEVVIPSAFNPKVIKCKDETKD